MVSDPELAEDLEKVSGQKLQISDEETEYSEVSSLEVRVSDSDVEVVAGWAKGLLEGCQQEVLEVQGFQVETHDNTHSYGHAFHAHCVSGL